MITLIIYIIGVVIAFILMCQSIKKYTDPDTEFSGGAVALVVGGIMSWITVFMFIWYKCKELINETN